MIFVTSQKVTMYIYKKRLHTVIDVNNFIKIDKKHMFQIIPVIYTSSEL